MTDDEVRRRARLATPLFLSVYLGIPLLFVAVIHATSAAYVAESAGRAYNYQALIVPGALLLVAAALAYPHRHRTARWPAAGAWFGGITALFGAFYLIVLDLEPPFGLVPILSLPVAAAGAAAGWAVGAVARHAIASPPTLALADSPYELHYRLRGIRNMWVVIGVDKIAVNERVPTPSGEGLVRRTVGPEFPLTALSAVSHVTLTGTEQLRYPGGIRSSPQATAGPALVFESPMGPWMLPLGDAATISAIVHRRRQRAQQAG